MPVIEFQVRPNCPACNSTEAKRRYRCPFGAPPISTYLSSFYIREPPELLGDYCVEECLACGTYFQSEVGTNDGRPSMSGWPKPSFRPGIRIISEASPDRGNQGTAMRS